MLKENGGHIVDDYHAGHATARREKSRRKKSDGQTLVAHHKYDAVSGEATSLADILAKLDIRQRHRRFAITQQMRMNLSTGAFVRTALGWKKDLPEKERKNIATAAASLVKSVEKNGIEVGNEAVSMVVIANKEARRIFDSMRDEAEKEMVNLARQLPVASWAKGIRGFGEKTLAIILSETGDLSGYPTPSHVWKRLGMAPRPAYEDEQRYQMTRRRRSEIYASLGDCLLKLNDGEYRAAYDDRRKHTAVTHPEWTKMHSHLDAHRYMEKRLLRNLWRAWREAKTGVTSGCVMPPAD